MIVVWILTVVLVLVFVASGGMKVLGLPYSERNRDRFGISPSLWRAVGVLELAGAVGLLAGIAVAALGVAAGVGLAVLMVGATATRLSLRSLFFMGWKMTEDSGAAHRENASVRVL